jgi:prostaglandin-endoperoxide synthase 2
MAYGSLSPYLVWFLRLPPVQWLLGVPWVARLFSRLAIERKVRQTRFRPYPFSLWTPGPATPPSADAYVAWSGLVDRSYTGRHLPPCDDAYLRRLPPVDEVAALFVRPALTPCPKSSALFCFFAQWFTDSFLRTSRLDPRKNTSNHEIDLCQIYGLDEATTAMLRLDRGGLLRTEQKAGGEFPELLFDANGRVRKIFKQMPYCLPDQAGGPMVIDDVLKQAKLELPADQLAARRANIYATGLERGNSTILYTALSTVFIREHNRICGLLSQRHQDWDDDRLFQTARNVNTVLLLRIIIEEYINHISDVPVRFLFDNGFAERRNWYRSNRIMIEFNLLYRWHSLVPDEFRLGGRLAPSDFRFNNALLEQQGVEAVIAAASAQPAGRIGLKNTPAFLLEAERRTIEFGRNQRLRSYNQYCTRFGEDAYLTFEDFTGDAALARELRSLYRDMDDVELVVGLLAEGRQRDSMIGDLMRTMIAVDAFSQALTNPLLSKNVYGPRAFGEEGMAVIEETRCLADIVRRNRPQGTPAGAVVASFAK